LKPIRKSSLINTYCTISKLYVY